jgi:hypothetical protein
MSKMCKTNSTSFLTFCEYPGTQCVYVVYVQKKSFFCVDSVERFYLCFYQQAVEVVGILTRCNNILEWPACVCDKGVKMNVGMVSFLKTSLIAHTSAVECVQWILWNKDVTRNGDMYLFWWWSHCRLHPEMRTPLKWGHFRLVPILWNWDIASILVVFSSQISPWNEDNSEMGTL